MRLQVIPIRIEAPQAQRLQAVGEARLDLSLNSAVPRPSLAQAREGLPKEGGVRIRRHGSSKTQEEEANVARHSGCGSRAMYAVPDSVLGTELMMATRPF